MSTAIWPISSSTAFWAWRGIAWDVTKRPEWKTIVQPGWDGTDAFTSPWQASKFHILLHWNFLRDAMQLSANVSRAFPANEADTLFAFYEKQRGGGLPFFWHDPTGDNWTLGEYISLSTPAVGADLSNPDSRNYRLVRTKGGATRPIGGLQTLATAAIVGPPAEPAMPVIYINGTPTTAYTANSPRDGWIRLDAAPSTGSTIYGDYRYYWRLHFPDTIDFHTFCYNFWELKQIELKEARR